MRAVYLLMCAGCCCAGARLVVDTVPAPPGGLALAVFRLEAEGRSVAAIQVDVQLPAEGFGITLAPALELQWAGKAVYAVFPGPNVTRFLIAGVNQWQIPDGVMFMIAFRVLENTAPAVYPLNILEAIAVDPDGEGIPLPRTDGSLVVSDPAAPPAGFRHAGRFPKYPLPFPAK